jgi:hypothetical protein
MSPLCRRSRCRSGHCYVVGSPTWIRTTIDRFRTGRPAIGRSGDEMAACTGIEPVSLRRQRSCLTRCTASPKDRTWITTDQALPGTAGDPPALPCPKWVGVGRGVKERMGRPRSQVTAEGTTRKGARCGRTRAAAVRNWCVWSGSNGHCVRPQRTPSASWGTDARKVGGPGWIQTNAGLGPAA